LARIVWLGGLDENGFGSGCPRELGSLVSSHGRYVAFQMAEAAIPRILFADIPRLVSELRPPPAVAST